MFATGIENSYPVITDQGKDFRVDEMEKCGFYQHWKEDFHLVCELGLQYLRYGPQFYAVCRGHGRYDWSFCDQTFEELRNLGITPIADLCHFGVPDWIGDFQNPDFPELFRDYARAFVERYPWVRFVTPVNEIFVCADFSAMKGWWNERLKSDRSFVTALKNMCRATVLAEQAMLEVNPSIIFIQSEATCYFHAREPAAEPRAEFLNQRRFLSFDLCYGHRVDSEAYEYLMDNGMSREEYHWFLKEGFRLRPHCVMGNDYYFTNEHTVGPGDEPHDNPGEIFGYFVLTRHYQRRYRLPVMHTETNLADAGKAPAWLWKEWCNMLLLKRNQIPIIGFTWYSLTDQVDWDTQLRENNGNVNALGLYDLNRKIRPVGVKYKQLVRQWADILPMDTYSLLHAGAPQRPLRDERATQR
jgi:beta-glucosidase/6-phospho-beta-glucosidase/beta-galactosidase